MTVVLVEQFVKGRELTVPVIGSGRKCAHSAHCRDTRNQVSTRLSAQIF